MTINQMLALKPGDKILVDGKVETFKRRSYRKWRNIRTGSKEWVARTQESNQMRHAHQLEKLDD